jgi:ADP-heptose:LPS heptosyltransferase
VRIVLSRLDRVGDLILSTPAIASVRRSWPRAHVTIVCSRYNATVVERSPDVDEVAIKPDGIAPAVFGRRFRGACDLAIALAPCAPDFQLVRATRAPVRVGYTYVRRYVARLTSRFYLTALGISEADPALCERRPQHVVRHEVEQVLDLVRMAGGTAIVPDLVVPIGDADRRAVTYVPPGAIVVHLGLRWFSEGGSRESTIALIASLRQFGLPIVATYGVDALAEVEAVRAAGVADAVVGGLSFAQWAAVFEKSRLVVTVDTGATHVASATRRPTVVLFEHRYFNLSSQEWSPYRVPSICLRKPATSEPAELAASRASIVSAVATLLAGTRLEQHDYEHS